METIYVVQGFNAGTRGRVVNLPPMTFKSEEEARRRAARLGETCLGVIAFAQTADVEAGEYQDPLVLERLGDVPEIS